MMLWALAGVVALLPSLVSAFTNPIIYEDLADVDVRRYNDTYYLSTSTFHYSPGAPILRSYDLANWEFIGHSVPSLAQYFGSGYALPPGQNAYNQGIWASWLIFVPSQDKWFWGGCVNFYQTHIFSTSGPEVTGPWSQISVINQCYYDSGAMLDDDGTVYVSFKDQSAIWVSQMSADMKTPVKTQIVFTPPSNYTSMEGTRPYKRNGLYYIFSSVPDYGTEIVLRSSSIFGTYVNNLFLSTPAPPSPLNGALGQGALVDTPSGQWYWMAFSWSYPSGRIPCLFPITWTADNWPVPTLVNGAVAASYPDVLTPHPLAPLTGVDSFSGTSLGPQWEWNHDPDTTKFSVNNGLTLSTASVTNDWYAARNTLTHRELGPISTATIKMTYSSMASGDRAGLGLLRDQSAYIGVWRSGSTYTVNMVNGINMNNSNFTTISTGSTAASAAVSGGTIWLRVIIDSTPAGNKGTFWYSQDGKTFTQLGPSFSTDTAWQFFEGQRFAILNFATSALGGSVKIASFEMNSGSYTGAASGAGGSSSSTAVASTSTKPVTSTTAGPTTTKPVTSSAPTTTSSSGGSGGSGCSSSLYAQCGGSGFTGCTTCASGSTCKYTNDWYSQCL